MGWITAQQEASLLPYLEALKIGLQEEGLREGQDLRIEYRYGNDDLSRVPALAQELAAMKVDLIVAQGAAAFEVIKLRLPVPIVYLVSVDPVSAGFADSLAQPRGNMTGLTFMAYEFASKRIELLQEMIPALQSVAVIGNPEHPGAQMERYYSEETGRRLNIKIRYLPTTNRDELLDAFRTVERESSQSISLLADGFAVQHRQTIIDFALAAKLPLISGWPVFAYSGALCTYGPRQTESYRRLAYFISRVLRGTKPADLPVERPTKFQMIVNLKTAKAIGISVPRLTLAKADDLLE